MPVEIGDVLEVFLLQGVADHLGVTGLMPQDDRVMVFEVILTHSNLSEYGDQLCFRHLDVPCVVHDPPRHVEDDKVCTHTNHMLQTDNRNTGVCNYL